MINHFGGSHINSGLAIDSQLTAEKSLRTAGSIPLKSEAAVYRYFPLFTRDKLRVWEGIHLNGGSYMHIGSKGWRRICLACSAFISILSSRRLGLVTALAKARTAPRLPAAYRQGVQPDWPHSITCASSFIQKVMIRLTCLHRNISI